MKWGRYFIRILLVPTPMTPGYRNPGRERGGAAGWWDLLFPKGRVRWVVLPVPLPRTAGRRLCRQHPGQQLPPSQLRAMQGEAGRNVGTAPGQPLPPGPEKSAELPARELCCQSRQWNGASQAGPTPGSEPSLPLPCELEDSGPSMGPGRRGGQAGRQGGQILESCDLPTG